MKFNDFQGHILGTTRLKRVVKCFNCKFAEFETDLLWQPCSNLTAQPFFGVKKIAKGIPSTSL